MAWLGMYIYFKMPHIMSRSGLEVLKHAGLEGMNLVRGVQMCTSLDHWVWGVVLFFEWSILMATVGRVNLGILAEGSPEVIASFCLCSTCTRDGRVVLLVPLGMQWGLILTRLRYISLIYEGVSITTMAPRGRALYAANGLWTWSYFTHWGGVTTSCCRWMGSRCGR